MGVEHGVGFTGNGRAVGVNDCQYARALFAGVTHSLDGVHGFTGLADGNGQGLFVYDRIAVAELVGELDFYRDTAPVLNGVLGYVTGVGGGAASNHDDLVHAAQHRGVDTHFV